MPVKQPMVSIIIPIFNAECYLRECLDSVCQQSMRDIEIICVDDASPDQSLSIVTEYAKREPRIKVLRGEENRGPGHARNRGLDAAEGEYIAFVDNDDWIKLNLCEVAYSAAKENHADILVFRMTDYLEETGIFEESLTIAQRYPIAEKESFCFLDSPWLMKLHFSACSRLFRAAFLKEEGIRFPEGIHYEDHPFFFETLLCARRVSILDVPLYYYRKHHSSVIHDDMKMFDIFRAYELSDRYIDKALPDRFLRRIYLQEKFLVLKSLTERVGFQQREAFFEKVHRAIGSMGEGDIFFDDRFGKDDRRWFQLVKRGDYQAMRLAKILAFPSVEWELKELEDTWLSEFVRPAKLVGQIQRKVMLYPHRVGRNLWLALRNRLRRPS